MAWHCITVSQLTILILSHGPFRLFWHRPLSPSLLERPDDPTWSRGPTLCARLIDSTAGPRLTGAAERTASTRFKCSSHWVSMHTRVHTTRTHKARTHAPWRRELLSQLAHEQREADVAFGHVPLCDACACPAGGGPWSTLTANSTPCVHLSADQEHARSSKGPRRQDIFSCDHGNRAPKRDDRRIPASRETWVLEPRAAERTAAGNALVWCAAVSSASPHHSSASPHRASEQSRITDLAWELDSALSSRDDAPTAVDPGIGGRAISVVSAQW